MYDPLCNELLTDFIPDNLRNTKAGILSDLSKIPYLLKIHMEKFKPLSPIEKPGILLLDHETQYMSSYAVLSFYNFSNNEELLPFFT